MVLGVLLAVVSAGFAAALAARRRSQAVRTRLEQELREAREAAADAARVRDDLVAMVSHELRTPLNTVLGWARLLRSGRLDPAAVARAVEILERSATDQARIVDDLLDVARLERGELRLDHREVSLVTVVEAALAAVRPAAAARGVALSAALMPAVPRVSGDPGRLQQVVWNLLSNAVKFTPAGGQVSVRLDREGDAAVIRVSDDGEGMDAAFLPHAFETFRQADSTSTRRHGGLGVGLAIVRHVVEAHGGSVTARSDGRGKGATFTVRLPMRRPAGGARPPGEGHRGAA